MWGALNGRLCVCLCMLPIHVKTVRPVAQTTPDLVIDAQHGKKDVQTMHPSVLDQPVS